LRFLLVGLGNRGGMWADILSKHAVARLSGAVDPDPAKRAAFSLKHPSVKVHPDLSGALDAGGHEAVLLVTPPDGHLAQTRLIAKAGLPLLAEKPLAETLEDAADIIRIMEQARLPLSVGLNFRYLPVSRAIRDLIAENRFGTPGFAQFSYQRNRDGKLPHLNKYPLTMRDPMMLEQSIHHLDLMRFAYQREAHSVVCRTFNPPWSMYAHDANVSCLIQFEGGLEANYQGTWSGGWNALQFEWRTDCQDGVIIQRELFSNLQTARTGDATLTPVVLPEAVAFVDDSRALLEAFIAAVPAGTPPPCDGRDHLKSLALCLAALQSSRTGKAVHMADFYRDQKLEALL
jgi:myo-inositol 2-dehydrogenase / D-chiro-inositol 1-dehydrogenase